MEYFLAIAGGQSGPHTQLEVLNRIREGTLKGDALAWRKGLPNWLPLRQLDEFEGEWPEIAQAAQEISATTLIEPDMPRPWLRFWARMIDYMWFTLALWFALGVLLPVEALSWLVKSVLSGAPLASMFFLAYIPVEAWLLSLRGTTPGKAFLRIQVRRLDGALPTFKQALMRSLQVYVKGVALWLPIACLVAMSYWRLRLLQRKATGWDEAAELHVEHGKPETWRFALLIAFLFVALFSLGLIFSLSPEAEGIIRGLPK